MDANDFDNFAVIRQQEILAGTRRAHRFIEKPAMDTLLPDLTDKRILMLGCGSGEESALLAAHGAVDMIGVDLSAISVALAQKTYPNCTFQIGDMHALEFEDSSFDFVYSSLSVHYSARPNEVYREVFRVLRPGGVFQFSVGHPMRWASEKTEINGVKHKLLGYSLDETRPRLYGSYTAFAEREDSFEHGDVLRLWIAPPSFHFRLLKESGFTVQDFVEVQAIDACKDYDWYYYERFSNFPQTMIFVASKNSE